MKKLVLIAIIILGGVGVFLAFNYLFGYEKNDLDTITIYTTQENFNQIKKKREEALELGILLSSKDDYVSATIGFDDEMLDSKIRLKGDWTDHLKFGDKWSYRIKLKGTYKGMRKFSVQHPKTRNYIYEWVFHKMQEELGITSLRYEFINLKINIDGKEKELGIFAVEEAFEKRLIENNQNREGVIIKINEDLLWEDRAYARIHNIPESKFYDIYMMSTIEGFTESNLLESENLKKQYQTAVSLLEAFRDNKIASDKVFDLDKMGKYMSLVNLIGGYHAAIWHNGRFYYNPITSRLEPVGFDAIGGKQPNYIIKSKMLGADSAFAHYRAKYLEFISNDKFLQNFKIKYGNQIIRLTSVLNNEFSEAAYDEGILKYNQNFIKKTLNFSQQISCKLEQLDNNFISIKVKNTSNFPIRVNEVNRKEKVIGLSVDTIIYVNPKSTRILFFKSSKKIKIDKTNKIRVTYSIGGTSIIRTEKVNELMSFETVLAKEDPIRMAPNFREFEFVYVDSTNKNIVFQSGNWKLTKSMMIPKGFVVKAREGFSLDFKNGSEIISDSPFQFEGSSTLHIKLFSSQSDGDGIFVKNTARASTFNYVEFNNLSNPKSENWELTGAITFYKSEVNFTNVRFKNNRSEDALNIVNSNFSINNCQFVNTYSDAFDGDFVKGKLSNSDFYNLGNDAIDISGSNIYVENISIVNAADKCISAGEKSSLKGTNIELSDSEIGITSKDLSVVELDSVSISNCKLGFTAFQKKSEFGGAVIDVRNVEMNNVSLIHLIDYKSSLILNWEKASISKNVIKRLYGKEFGKSSKQ